MRAIRYIIIAPHTEKRAVLIKESMELLNNCSAYGEKGDIPKDFKQGDFVKLFGQIRTSVDDNGKEHTNIRILSSKLLKAKKTDEKTRRKERICTWSYQKISG